jgi:hypothetical protein
MSKQLIRLAAIPLSAAAAFGLSVGPAAAAGTTFVGSNLTDSATLTGSGISGGQLVFTLYLFPNPQNEECTIATQVFQSSVPVTGPGTYTSDQFATQDTGIYQWVAVYQQDSNNQFTVGGLCGDPSEQTVVTAGPNIGTVPGTNTTPVGQ